MSSSAFMQMASSQVGQVLIKEIAKNYYDFGKAHLNKLRLEEYVSLYEIVHSEIKLVMKKLDGPRLDSIQSQQLVDDVILYLELLDEVKRKIEKIVRR